MNAPLSLPAVFDALDGMHSWRGWHWWPDADPFEVCVGCILVQNTSWANVEKALARLRAARALDPDAMAALAPGAIEQLIRPAGQYRQKALKLAAFLETCGASGSFGALMALPAAELRPRLLATWGIGEETADAMVVYAARQPAVVIDAYTRRVFGRLGLGPPAAAAYGEWQRLFEADAARIDPGERRDYLARYHALVVMHAKHLCRKRSPRCGECALRGECGGPGAGA